MISGNEQEAFYQICFYSEVLFIAIELRAIVNVAGRLNEKNKVVDLPIDLN